MVDVALTPPSAKVIQQMDDISNAVSDLWLMCKILRPCPQHTDYVQVYQVHDAA